MRVQVSFVVALATLIEEIEHDFEQHRQQWDERQKMWNRNDKLGKYGLVLRWFNNRIIYMHTAEFKRQKKHRLEAVEQARWRKISRGAGIEVPELADTTSEQKVYERKKLWPMFPSLQALELLVEQQIFRADLNVGDIDPTKPQNLDESLRCFEHDFRAAAEGLWENAGPRPSETFGPFPESRLSDEVLDAIRAARISVATTASTSTPQDEALQHDVADSPSQAQPSQPSPRVYKPRPCIDLMTGEEIDTPINSTAEPDPGPFTFIPWPEPALQNYGPIFGGTDDGHRPRTPDTPSSPSPECGPPSPSDDYTASESSQRSPCPSPDRKRKIDDEQPDNLEANTRENAFDVGEKESTPASNKRPRTSEPEEGLFHLPTESVSDVRPDTSQGASENSQVSTHTSHPDETVPNAPFARESHVRSQEDLTDEAGHPSPSFTQGSYASVDSGLTSQPSVGPVVPALPKDNAETDSKTSEASRSPAAIPRTRADSRTDVSANHGRQPTPKSNMSTYCQQMSDELSADTKLEERADMKYNVYSNPRDALYAAKIRGKADTADTTSDTTYPREDVLKQVWMMRLKRAILDVSRTLSDPATMSDFVRIFPPAMAQQPTETGKRAEQIAGIIYEDLQGYHHRQAPLETLSSRPVSQISGPTTFESRARKVEEKIRTDKRFVISFVRYAEGTSRLIDACINPSVEPSDTSIERQTLTLGKEIPNVPSITGKAPISVPLSIEGPDHTSGSLVSINFTADSNTTNAIWQPQPLPEATNANGKRVHDREEVQAAAAERSPKNQRIDTAQAGQDTVPIRPRGELNVTAIGQTQAPYPVLVNPASNTFPYNDPAKTTTNQQHEPSQPADTHSGPGASERHAASQSQATATELGFAPISQTQQGLQGHFDMNQRVSEPASGVPPSLDGLNKDQVAQLMSEYMRNVWPRLSDRGKVQVFTSANMHQSPEIYSRLGPRLRVELLQSVTDYFIRNLLDNASAVYRFHLIAQMSQERRSSILERGELEEYAVHFTSFSAHQAARQGQATHITASTQVPEQAPPLQVQRRVANPGTFSRTTRNPHVEQQGMPSVQSPVQPARTQLHQQQHTPTPAARYRMPHDNHQQRGGATTFSPQVATSSHILNSRDTTARHQGGQPDQHPAYQSSFAALPFEQHRQHRQPQRPNSQNTSQAPPFYQQGRLPTGNNQAQMDQVRYNHPQDVAPFGSSHLGSQFQHQTSQYKPLHRQGMASPHIIDLTSPRSAPQRYLGQQTNISGSPFIATQHNTLQPRGNYSVEQVQAREEQRQRNLAWQVEQRRRNQDR